MELTTSRYVLKLSLHVSFSQILLGSSGKKTVLYELPVTKPTEHSRHWSEDFKEVCQVKSIQKYEATGDSYTSSYFPYEGVLTRKFKLWGKFETEVEIWLSVNLTTEWGPYSSGPHLSDPPVMKSLVLALYPRLISGPRRRFGNPVWKQTPGFSS